MVGSHRAGGQLHRARDVGLGRWGPGQRKEVGAGVSAPKERGSQLDLIPPMSQSWHLRWLIMSTQRTLLFQGAAKDGADSCF